MTNRRELKTVDDILNELTFPESLREPVRKYICALVMWYLGLRQAGDLKVRDELLRISDEEKRSALQLLIPAFENDLGSLESLRVEADQLVISTLRK